MAEPFDTVSKLQKSFDSGGPALDRYDLATARQTLAECAVRQPHNSSLPWWIARVDNRLHFIDTGEVRPEPAKPQTTTREKAIGWAVIGVFVLVVGGCTIAVTGDDDGGGEGGRDDIGAKVMCEQFIEGRLKSPSSADFQNSGEYVVTGAGNEYTVKGYVDADNSFGASLRANWTCTVRDNGDESWNLVSLTGID